MSNCSVGPLVATAAPAPVAATAAAPVPAEIAPAPAAAPVTAVAAVFTAATSKKDFQMHVANEEMLSMITENKKLDRGTGRCKTGLEYQI